MARTRMTKKERIELGAHSLVYCYDNGHEVMNLPTVLDIWKTYSLETCEAILERAKEILKERGER